MEGRRGRCPRGREETGVGVEGATQGMWWSQANKKDAVRSGGMERWIYTFGRFCPRVDISPWGSLSAGGLSPGRLSPFQGPALPILGSLCWASPLMSPVSQLFIFMAGPPPDKEAIAAEVCRHRNSHRCFSFCFSEDSAALATALASETGGEAAYISSDNSMIFVVGTQEPCQIPLYSTDTLTSKHPTTWTAHTP
ncbi:uncharacterized protein ACIBXB_008705 [Morphnus guianensis]